MATEQTEISDERQLNSEESQQNSEQHHIEYPSSETLLNTISREYDAEANRKRDIETRAGVLIALLGALIGFYATALDFSFFKKAHSPIEMLCFAIIALLYIFPAIMQLIAFKHLINVLKTYEYQSLGLSGFNEDDGSLNNNARLPKDELQYALTDSYYNIVKKNSNANDTKAKLYKKGIEKIYISIIGIVLVYMIKQVILLMV
ncbi:MULTISPECIES: hypothetical protein [Bacillus]|uniref:hypothetical protein n=1 Tax=Bacillus TaxID=1386 RepID=UPI00142FA99F|nr:MULTISPECIES: hypothetical protein [Bacillus]MCY7782410.1 hypothetical protein [Bacillus sp. S20C3]MCY8287779.1 hypothetical protein [Bacillus sp. N13C7]MCY8639888.1 hypothetical protein [Bacillus sp. S17B2]MCY9142918.1 hypothetical protein [Bacillus sp. T9C1]MCW0117908.1 hypothetical protein [Bacillus subtilis]